MTKPCKKCGVEKPMDAYTLERSTVKGKVYEHRRHECKVCVNARVRKYNLAARYSLTEKQYDELIATGCAVCGTKENLVIDHDHACCPTTESNKKSCGKCIRGVLCQRHNKALGFVSDNVDELMGLAAYVMQSRNVIKEVSE